MRDIFGYSNYMLILFFIFRIHVDMFCISNISSLYHDAMDIAYIKLMLCYICIIEFAKACFDSNKQISSGYCLPLPFLIDDVHFR